MTMRKQQNSNEGEANCTVRWNAALRTFQLGNKTRSHFCKARKAIVAMRHDYNQRIIYREIFLIPSMDRHFVSNAVQY
jgi:hypothetical protein